MTRSVELCVAGTSCRVVTTADDAELAVLTAMVEDKLASVLKPGRPMTKQAVLLAAIALANDVCQERARGQATAARAAQVLRGLLGRVDACLGAQPLLIDAGGATAEARSERPRGGGAGASIERLRERHQE